MTPHLMKDAGFFLTRQQTAETAIDTEFEPLIEVNARKRSALL